MVTAALISILAVQGASASVDVPLHEINPSALAYSVDGSAFSQSKDDLTAIKGYKLPKGIAATHSGTIRVGNRQVAYYGVRDKKLFQFEEIGIDLNGNKVFENSEIAHYISSNPRQKATAEFTFKNQTSQPVRLIASRTIGISVGPARLLRGSARFGDVEVQFTLTDTNMDGKFSTDDTVSWIDRSLNSQTLEGLFAMPDGTYYSASLPTSRLLRFTRDNQPTATIHVKNGQIDAFTVLLNGKGFTPSISKGTAVLPAGSYQIKIVAFSAKADNGLDYSLTYYCKSEDPTKVEAGKDISLDYGPLTSVSLSAEGSGEGFGFSMNAYGQNGDRMARLYLVEGSQLKTVPQPVIEVFDPSGSKAAEIKLEYG